MKYIVDCPSCGRKIRFPLDKGRIKVFCTCGYNTLIDPDDTALYNSGKFDIKPEDRHPEKSGSFFDSINSLLNKFTWSNFVNALLEGKYKLQNFRYLPDKERNRLIVIIIAVILAVSAAMYYL